MANMKEKSVRKCTEREERVISAKMIFTVGMIITEVIRVITGMSNVHKTIQERSLFSEILICPTDI